VRFMSDKAFQIVLYKNRKLYCKESSAYIKLSDIYNMFRNSLQLVITEHATNKDITKDIIFKAVMHFGPNYETKVKLINKIGGRV